MAVVRSLHDVVCQKVLRTLGSEITIVGVTGRNGAGKSSKVAPAIKTIIQESGVWAEILPLDAFLILSSADRAAWIAVGDQRGPEEAARRRNELNWWDFNKLDACIQSWKKGNHIHLRNIRNPADNGRLTGELLVPAPEKRGVLILEGKGVAHLDHHDVLFFVHAPSYVRLERLRHRDTYRTPEETAARFQITERFEDWYFAQYQERIDYWVDNSSQEKDLLVSTDLEEIL